MIHRWNLHKPRPRPTTQIFFEDLALRDRSSVIRFVGFSVMSDTPDYSTISRFRSRLLGLKMYGKLFDEINRQLAKKGFAGTNLKGFILNGLMTPANVSEISKFPDVLNILNLSPDTPVLADKGYSSDKNRQILTDLGLKDFIMQKVVRGRKLTEYQKTINKGISKVRYVIEQVFGILKKHYNFYRCRYGGLEKVNT